MSAVSSSDPEIYAAKIVEYLKETEESQYVADLYVKGCEAFWVSGTPKEDCAAKLAKLIRDLKYPDDPKQQWHSGYFWEVVKEHGFTKSVGTPAQEYEDSSAFTLRLIPEQQETYAKSPYYQMRLRYIDLLMLDIWFAEQMLKELQKNYEDLIDPITGESRPDTNTLRDCPSSLHQQRLTAR